MEVRAHKNTVKLTPRKARLVIDLIRGKDAKEALYILKMSTQKAARVAEKVLNQAVANAVNNHKLDVEKLYVKKAFIDEGVTMKRFQPRAHGSADRKLKRTAHVTIIVEEKETKK